MSSIIHALKGHGDHSEKKSNVHTVIHDDVQVKSTINCETQSKLSHGHFQGKINQLMSKLGSTHAQIDEYARRRTEEISDAVQQSIEKIVHETETQQQQLLNHAHQEATTIDSEYREKLTKYVNQLDDEKAATLAQLEKDLNIRQEQILDAARKRIDQLNEEANRLKMTVLKEAQAQANSKIGVGDMVKLHI